MFYPETEWITNRLSTKNPSKWIPGDIQPMPRQFPEQDYSRYKDMSPVELFELFFDEDICQYITKQTPLYAQFKNKTDPGITLQENSLFYRNSNSYWLQSFTFEAVVLGFERGYSQQIGRRFNEKGQIYENSKVYTHGR